MKSINLQDRVSDLVFDIENDGCEDSTELIAVVKHGDESFQVHLKVIKSTSNDFIDWEDNVPHFSYSDGYLTAIND